MEKLRSGVVRKLALACGLSLAALAVSAGPIQDVEPGKWYEIPNSALRSVVPSPAPAGDPKNIMNAWSGATYDTDREQLIVWGGGHSDYSGNEVYAFGPLTSESPKWTRLTDPSQAQSGASDTYADGKPRSTHTYDLLLYHQNAKKMISFGLGSTWTTGGESRRIFGFDPATKQWDPVDTHPAAKTTVQGTSAQYDPATGLIWHRGAGNTSLESYNVATGEQKTYNDGFGYFNIYYTAAIDPARRIMIGVGGYNGGGPIDGANEGVVVWDLASPGNSFIAKTSGDKAMETRSNIGLEFHPPSGTFIAWNGGATVYRLTPPSDLRNGTWNWQALAPASGSATPTQANPQGTYGRFAYVPSLDIFVAVNQVDGNVYVYRLGGSPAPQNPAVALSASPAQVNLQGSSTLTWSSTNADSCTASGAWSGSKATSGNETVGPLSADATYTLTCTNSEGGSTTKSVTVTIVTSTPVPSVLINANPSSITSGSSTTLSWTTTDATSCTGGGAWSGAKAVNGSQSVGPLTATSTFTLTCTGAGGTNEDFVTVNVSGSSPPPPPPPPAAPTLTLTANPASIASGGTSSLTWSSTNATSCTASGSWSGSKATSGSQGTGTLTANATYTLQCTGAGGSVSRSATVTVTQPAAAPTVALSANPATVTPNGGSTLSWTSTNATSCTASGGTGGWSGTVATSGSMSISSVPTTTTFTLTCTGSGGTAEDSAQVLVVAQAQNPPQQEKADGGGGSLEWLTLVVLALLILVGCKAKQMPSTARALVPAAALATGAVVQPAVAADLTTVSITTGAGSGDVPVVFGQVFKPGDVPGNTAISASTTSGTPIPLQVDRKATHGDGSLRHAILTAQVPAGSSNLGVKISTGGSAASGSAVTLANLLATSFDAEARLSVGGTVYSLKARDLLQSGTPTQWLSGPFVSEWVVGGSVKNSSGTAHPHLAAYFHVRAFAGQPINRVRVDVIIENGWTMVNGPRDYTYDATILVGGNTVYTKNVNHYHHARWHKRFWWGSEISAYVKQDPTYLQATGAVPRYPNNIQLTTSFLNSLRDDVEPMSNGDLMAYFPTTGGAATIGPLPIWTASYVISGDERPFKSMLANDRAAGAYGVHYRDELTGRPVSIGDRPMLTTRFSQDEVGEDGSVPGASGNTPLTPDDAHQPSIAFVSYLTTGDFFFLEELQFWASYNHLIQNPHPPNGYRQGSKGILGGQVRGQAWALRNIAQAAYATPDDHPYKSVLVNSVVYNLQEVEETYADNPNANKLGALRSYDGYDLFAPWMDDFYTFVMGYLVDLGFPAEKMRAWKAKFPVGRMGTTDYCYKQASTYRLVVGTSNSSWYSTFAELYQRNFGTLTSCPLGGPMDGYPDNPEGYVANLRPALAVAVDSGIPGAQEAWDRMISSSPQINFTNYPNWAVIPRGSPVGGGGSNVLVSLSANPTSVQSGANTTLSWSSVNATSCTASGGWSGSKATSGTQSVGPITTNTTYTISCTGNGQTVERSVDVTLASAPPPPPPAPTVNLTANPTSVASGGSTTLSWSSTNATACTASNGWSGSKATSGSQTISNITANRTFTLSCTGAGGSASANASVTLSSSPPPPPPPPAAGVSISATPSSVTTGGSTQVQWTSTNATSCTASGAWSGTKGTSGSETISNLTTTSSFSLQCTGAGGPSATASTTVTVTSPQTSPPPSNEEKSDGGGGAFGWFELLFLLGLGAASLRHVPRLSRFASAVR